MTLIQVTLNLAFHDIIDATADNVRNQIINYALDGFEAEIAFTSDCKERHIAVADPDFDADDANEQVERWQEQAREELEGVSHAQ